MVNRYNGDGDGNDDDAEQGVEFLNEFKQLDRKFLFELFRLCAVCAQGR